MDAERFVFLDETGATTAMTRLSGWGPKGQRLVDAAPHGHWKTTTVVAGLRASGIIAPFVLDGPMTGEAFRAYVEQVLAPELEPGDAVVMDNLAAHTYGKQEHGKTRLARGQAEPKILANYLGSAHGCHQPPRPPA